MMLARQRLTDLNKSLAIPLLERKNNHRKFRLEKKAWIKVNAIRQRGRDLINVN